MVLPKTVPEQLRQLPDRFDEAQGTTPIVRVCKEDVQVERLRIIERDAELLVPRGPQNLVWSGHLAVVRQQLHERVEGVQVP